MEEVTQSLKNTIYVSKTSKNLSAYYHAYSTTKVDYQKLSHGDQFLLEKSTMYKIVAFFLFSVPSFLVKGYKLLTDTIVLMSKHINFQRQWFTCQQFDLNYCIYCHNTFKH